MDMDMYYMTSKRGRGLPPQNVNNTYVYFILQFSSFLADNGTIWCVVHEADYRVVFFHTNLSPQHLPLTSSVRRRFQTGDQTHIHVLLIYSHCSPTRPLFCYRCGRGTRMGHAPKEKGRQKRKSSADRNYDLSCPKRSYL